MPKANNSGISRRVWNLLQLALLRARRGGASKLHLHLLVPSSSRPSAMRHILYGERELSFEKTPVVHVKMHRPGSMRFMLPCINPRVDFDMEFDEEDGDGAFYGYDITKKGLFLGKGDKEECYYDGDDYGRIEREEEELGIDSRAEEFIAKFYEQMKLQRQMSYLQYNEMLNRSAS
ncbi:hypothetical protein BT93_C2495 [Corymbia citriodora subsp. variegata]|nr:hypothetical protein BT93_C2495 [Corymbia citriodora subsp. variegata]